MNVRLQLLGEVRAHERHADWFAAWIEKAAERYERTRSSQIAREAMAAHDDLMVVLEDAVATGDAELAARCALSLAWYWLWRGRWREGRAWVDRVRGLRFPAGSAREAEMFRLAAVLGGADGDYARVRPLVEEALRRARAVGDATCEVRCLNELSFAAARLGDEETAWGLLNEALALATEEERPTARMILLANAGALAAQGGDTERARDLLARALTLAEWHENVKVMGIAHLHGGRLERQLRGASAAWPELKRAWTLLDASGHLDLSARARLHLALSHVADGESEAAAALLDGCLTDWWESGLIGRLPDALRVVAALTARRGDPPTADRLWRAADRVAPATATLLFPSERAFLAAGIEDVGAEPPRGREHASAPDPDAPSDAPSTVAAAVGSAREALRGRGDA